MTLVFILNAIFCGGVVVGVVAPLAWAILTQHRNEPVAIAAARKHRRAPARVAPRTRRQLHQPLA